MNDGHAELFEPLAIGPVRLRNRIVVPPMAQVRPVASPEGIAWYRRFAAGGAGLVIVEGLSVARFRAELTAAALRPLADAIHAEGAAAVVQLFPILPGKPAEPGSLAQLDIEAMIDLSARAAVVCRDAGFDGVEPHGAHGFLLNQFFMPDRNRRADRYGGSIENRGRLGREIVERIRCDAGGSLLIFYRHTPVGEAYSLDESLEFAGILVGAGVDVLDISPARGAEVADLAAPFKAKYPVPVVAVGGMEDPAAAAAALRGGRCDLVALGRELIADAEWPRKVQEGRIEDILMCTKCDDCFADLRARRPVACSLWRADGVRPHLGR